MPKPDYRGLLIFDYLPRPDLEGIDKKTLDPRIVSDLMEPLLVRGLEPIVIAELRQSLSRKLLQAEFRANGLDLGHPLRIVKATVTTDAERLCQNILHHRKVPPERCIYVRSEPTDYDPGATVTEPESRFQLVNYNDPYNLRMAYKVGTHAISLVKDLNSESENLYGNQYLGRIDGEDLFLPIASVREMTTEMVAEWARPIRGRDASKDAPIIQANRLAR